MLTALGGFIEQLDDKLEIHDARVYVPTRNVELTARSLRVKILQAAPRAPDGRLSAVVQGASGSLARSVYPDLESFWNRVKVPEIPLTKDEGTVKDISFQPGACLPEIEQCQHGTEAKPIPLDRPVTSEGFMVYLSLSLSGFEPGTRIRGVVVLSDV